MSWLSKLMPSGIRTEAGAAKKNKRSVPEGLWEKCDRCGAVLYRPELEENLEVCPKCNFHMAIRARARLAALFDPGSTQEIGATLGPVDALKFKDQKKYADRIKASQKSSGERDALVTLQGLLKERPLVACAFDFAFMGGSMGTAVGEGIVRAAETAVKDGAALIVIPSSGGARMQEGALSLMQMPRSRSSMTFMPACLARRRRSEYTAGMVPLPGSAMPNASHRQFMEFAVNMPEQEPQVGHAVSSKYLSSSSVMVPAATWPAPSKSVFRSVVAPCEQPG